MGLSFDLRKRVESLAEAVSTIPKVFCADNTHLAVYQSVRAVRLFRRDEYGTNSLASILQMYNHLNTLKALTLTDASTSTIL
jgi:hypothetical protein